MASREVQGRTDLARRCGSELTAYFGTSVFTAIANARRVLRGLSIEKRISVLI